MGKGTSSGKKKKRPIRKGGEILETLNAATKIVAKQSIVVSHPMPSVMVRGNSSEAMSDQVESSAKASNKIEICKNHGCHDIMTTYGFCRFHYLASWRKLKTKEAKRKGQELEVYLKDLSRKFPEEFLDKLRTEIEEMAEKEAAPEAEDTEKPSLFDSIEGDEDLETIISGLKVEDF